MAFMRKTHPGADVLCSGHDDTTLQWLRGQRVGLVTNHTGRLIDTTPLLQALRVLEVPVVALFSPEHGPQGTEEGNIESGRTSEGLPIHSLYGATRCPTDAMLQDIEALVFDIQDVGARFYTYSTTLAFCMEECAARNIPVLVLDRPNPLGGVKVEGPLLEDDCRSFIGHVRLPVVHGLTLGEIAQWHRVQTALDVDLRVVTAHGWKRDMTWPATELEWTAPSPNLPDYASAAWYPATCLLEFSGVSVGRGTPAPFRIVGAPWMDAQRVLDAALSWPADLRESVLLEAIDFTPTRAIFEADPCHGVQLHCANIEQVSLTTLGLAMLDTIHRTHPQHVNEEKLNAASPLIGSRRVLDAVRNGNMQEALAVSQTGAQQFCEERAAYLLYD
jgi:beta-N-acetylhexosaminidase